jgi:anhydro-N-acetylmuramic acid kinase
MAARWIIGLASGSSMDGVDAALVELDGVGLELRLLQVQGLHQPYGADLRELIRRVSGSTPCEVRQVSRLHRLLGETFAAAARTVADHASLSLQKVQCIGCPGHTVWHDSDGRFPSTLGLGMAAVIAERCGVTTVSDFRTRDVAAGGQGVPLAALADHLLFRHPQEGRALLHLGGLARVVFLPAGCRLPEVIGFEAGPCNALLDALMRQLTGGREAFDPGGKHAVQGKCCEILLQRWLAHPYLQRRPPKSLPRHTFADDFAAQAVQQARQAHLGLHDLLCTATHFVARGITLALRRFLPPGQPVHRALLSGGGVRNGLLWQLLAQQLEGVPLDRTDEVGVPADVRKSLSFGVLAALTLDGVPGNVPSATGAAGSRLLGSLTPGSSANWARCLAWMAAQTSPPAPVAD